MNNKLITKSAQETQQLGRELAQSMQGGEIVLLFGDLGAGKTTFMQGFAEGLGLSQRIISPTFIIMRSYDIDGKVKKLYHIDLYRTETDADLEGLGVKEIMEDKNAIVAIEWSEKLQSLLPEKRIEIRFNPTGENEREIIVNYVS